MNVGLNDLLKVTFSVLHYHVDRIESGRVIGLQDFDKVYDKRMSKLSQQSHLPQNSFAINLIVEDVLHALDGHLLARRLLRGKHHLPVAASAEEAFA